MLRIPASRKPQRKNCCIQKKAAEIAPRRQIIIKTLSLLITENSRQFEECLLLQAIQDIQHIWIQKLIIPTRLDGLDFS